MSTITFSIPLGSVNLDGLNTDEDFRREAERLLPDALTNIGEKTAEFTLSELQKRFRGIAGFKVNTSVGDKSRFIREGGRNHRLNASTQHRLAVTNNIIQQLREMKRKAG